MFVRLIVIAASALAGVLGTLYLRTKVCGEDSDMLPMPGYAFRPRPRRAPRNHLESRPDGEGVQP